MSKVRAPAASLSGMLDDGSDDDLTQSVNDFLSSPDSAVENIAPPKKKATASSGKSANNAAKATKTKAPSRRVSGGGVKKAAAKKGTTTSRKALTERNTAKANTRGDSDVEEVEDFDDSVEVVEDEKPIPVAATEKKKTKARQDRDGAKKPRTKRQPDREEVQQQKHETNKQAQAAPRIPASKGRSAAKKKAPSNEPQHVIPETQFEPMDVDVTAATTEGDTGTIKGDSSTVEPLPAISKPPPNRRPAAARAGSESRQRRPERTRSASASDREGRISDPALRRKLGDTTKKLESLEIKYRNLQEVGTRTAESNFEKLKKASDERAKHSNELVASLKKDLADLQKRLDTQIAESSSDHSKVTILSDQNKNLEAENKTLKQSLQQTEGENRTLAAKVAANRTASVEPAEKEKKATTTNSFRASTTGPKNASASNAEAAKETQIRQLKEDLYSDLTGLLIRGVKREEGEDIYDCIQTGRNGTLHFHLTVANPASTSDPKTPSNAYEEAEFGYTPLLDDSRDKELKEVLEDYLQEEIFFPRWQAAKFYGKVMECVTKKIVVEDEE
ncbi:MAG: hypothetical protein M1820_002807 [Bogoriella megaspora]|nr:MAG: hypothetical protein M1820_002807 [Bogoriella megaspora]